jgi:hypothetical protein
MSAFLPALLAVPVILTVLFETPLLKYLRRFTEAGVNSRGGGSVKRRRYSMRQA